MVVVTAKCVLVGKCEAKAVADWSKLGSREWSATASLLQLLRVGRRTYMYIRVSDAVVSESQLLRVTALGGVVQLVCNSVGRAAGPVALVFVP